MTRQRSTRSLRFAPALGALLLAGSALAQTVVGTIARPGLRPWSLAVYEAGNKLFVGDMATSHLLVYDGTSLALLAELTVPGFTGDCIMTVDEPRGRLFLSGFGTGVAVVDAVTNQVITTVAGSFNWYAALDEGLGRLYLLDFSDELLHAIDTTTFAKTTVALSCPSCIMRWARVGVDPVTHEVFVTNLNADWIDIFDGSTLARTTVPITGARTSFGQAVNWIDHKVYGARNTFDGYWIYSRGAGTTTIVDTFAVNDAVYVFFDPVSNRVYTDSEVDSRVTILDGASDAIVFNLPMWGGPLLSSRTAGQPGSWLYIPSNHVYYLYPESVAVVDDATQVVEVIPIDNPSPSAECIGALAVNQTTGRVFVVNDADALNAVTVIQETGRLTRPPVYVGSKASSTIHTLDPAEKRVVDTEVGQPWQGLAVRPGGGRLWEATKGFSSNGALEVFAGIGAASSLTWLESGGVYPTGVAFSPDGSRLYVTNSGSDDLSVIAPADLSVVMKVSVGTTPWGLAVAPDGSKVYVANKGDGTVSVIATASNAVTKAIQVGASPWGVAVNPAGTKVYVADSGSGTVSVIATATDTVTATIPVGTSPHGIALAPDGARAYVTNRGSGTVSVIDTGTDDVIQTLDVVNPEGIGALPDGSEVWVVSSNLAGASAVAVIKTSDLSVTNVALPGTPGGGSELFVGSTESIPMAISDPTSRFAGRVTSGAVPFVGAAVRALQSGVVKGMATSDESGDWAIPNLLAGTYDLEADGPAHAVQTIPAVPVGTGRTALRSFAFVSQLPGDVDGNGTVSAADIFFLVNHLFASGPAPLGDADVDEDGDVGPSDVDTLVDQLFT